MNAYRFVRLMVLASLLVTAGSAAATPRIFEFRGRNSGMRERPANTQTRLGDFSKQPSSREMISKGATDVRRGAKALVTATKKVVPLAGYSIAGDTKQVNFTRGVIKGRVTVAKRQMGGGLRGMLSGFGNAVANPLRAAGAALAGAKDRAVAGVKAAGDKMRETGAAAMRSAISMKDFAVDGIRATGEKVRETGAAVKRSAIETKDRAVGEVKAASKWTQLTANLYKSSARYSIKATGYKIAGDSARAHKAETVSKGMRTKADRRVGRAARAMGERVKAAVYYEPSDEEKKMVFGLGALP